MILCWGGKWSWGINF